MLHLYREVNLIYSFTEKLASTLDVEKVARLTLGEARQLIAATDGVVMLLDEPANRLCPVADFGEVYATGRGSQWYEGLFRVDPRERPG